MLGWELECENMVVLVIEIAEYENTYSARWLLGYPV